MIEIISNEVLNNVVRDFQHYKQPVTNTVSDTTMTVADAYHYIISNTAEEATTHLRQLKDPKEIRDYKSTHFDFVCFSGTFSHRNAANLIHHSGMLCLDFDHLTPQQMMELNPALCRDPYLLTLLLFVSPSGHGLKWVVAIDTDKADHLTWFHAVQAYVKQTYGVDVDSQCKDVCRPCFLPFDPACYVCPEALDPATETAYIDSMRSIRTDNYRLLDFDPMAWLPQSQPSVPLHPTPARPDIFQGEPPLIEEVQEVAHQICLTGVDITAGYENWLKLGFALTEGLGEDGRIIFHDLSGMNPEYNREECDRQYTRCLHAKGTGVTLRSFFQMAKDAGVDLAEHRREVLRNADSQRVPARQNSSYLLNDGEPILPSMPTFSDKLSDQDLCHILREVRQNEDTPEDADTMIMSVLTATSVVAPTITGVYFERTVYPNFYCCVLGPAGNSKGRMTAVLKFLNPVEQILKARYQHAKVVFDQEMADYQRENGRSSSAPAPQEPPYLSLFIPADSSTSAVVQQLNDNGGEAMTFASEIDNMTRTLSNDYGDYSDLLRAAFHNELMALNRRKNNEHISIECPRWTVLLSGTYKQLGKLVPDAENGLFSRFLFLVKTQTIGWRDPFDETDMTLDERYTLLGQRYLPVYLALDARRDNPIRFTLTMPQRTLFNQFFKELSFEQHDQLGGSILSSVRRLGLVFFRICMVLSALRLADREDSQLEDGQLMQLPDTIVCDDRDFRTAMTIINTLVSHTDYVFDNLLIHTKEENSSLMKLTEQQLSLYQQLGEQFTTQDFYAESDRMGFCRSTVKKWLANYQNKYRLITRIKNGLYRKEHPTQPPTTPTGTVPTPTTTPTLSTPTGTVPTPTTTPTPSAPTGTVPTPTTTPTPSAPAGTVPTPSATPNTPSTTTTPLIP